MKHLLFCLPALLALYMGVLPFSARESFAQTETWTQKADLPLGRHHPVTWGFGDTGYVVTGTDALNQPSDDFYRYDAASDTWTSLNNFPGGARSFAIGEEYQGKGYMGFGASQFRYFNDLWEYDPQTNTWTELASCPCSGRRHPSLVIRDGRLFVGLGDDASGNLNDWWEYDIANDQWTQRDNLPGPPRHHPFQFTAGTDVYAGMGHGGRFIYGDWYRFDLDSNRWVQMSNFPGEARVAGTQFDFNGKGYVLSGDGSNHNFMPEGEFWEYDPAADTWTELPPHPGNSHWAPGSFLLGNTLYMIAGRDRPQAVNTAEVYSYTFGVPASTESAPERAATVSLYPNPARAQSTLSFALPRASRVRYRIVDATGRTVRQAELGYRPAGEHQIRLPLDALSDGLYLVEWRSGLGAKTLRLDVR